VIDHITIRASDPTATERFYETVLPIVGARRTGSAGEFGEGCAEFAEWGDFSIAADGPPTTGLHVGFAAESRGQVDAFWQAGMDAGFRSDGEPGPRPSYVHDYYGAFLLDPDGNSIEALHYAGAQAPGEIDHVWIRVGDLPAAVAFYEAIAEFSGEPKRDDHGDHVHFGAASAFVLAHDGHPSTRNLHLAFGTHSNDVVDAFHAAATAARYRDNGGPGERPQYHAGYYGAFVLDPDGNNIEVVNHNR
jgi:catechol 2,3-dioxygenase-like lactoylglutathione lyase family enzyme